MLINGRMRKSPIGTVRYVAESDCFVIRVDDNEDPSFWLEMIIDQNDFYMAQIKASNALTKQIKESTILPAYPCCEGARRIEARPGDATSLAGGICPIHGLSKK